MTFWEWLKSLFKKKEPVVKPLPRVNPSKPVPVKDPKYADKYVEPKHMKYVDADTGLGEHDPAFVKRMSGRWKKITGLALTTIIGSYAAWCQLYEGHVYDLAGYQFVVSGLAIHADKMGQPVDYVKDGISRGMGLRLNHRGDCKKSSGNHVTNATGFCAPQDILEMTKGADGVWRLKNGVKKWKPGVFINGKGGNQGDKVQGTNYPVYEICHVFWPKEEKLPPPVTKSLNCASGKTTGGSTR